MPEQVSSRRKRTAKAATRRRSTTSSTTGAPSPVKLVRNDGTPVSSLADDDGGSAAIPVPESEAALLSRAQQDTCMKMLFYGASPPMVCARLGLSVTSFLRTVTEDQEFAERVRQAHTGLSQNAAARLYRTAMEGNVAALRFYLQLRPPPEWSDAAPQVVDLEELEPDELADEYRARGLDVPAELEALAGCTNGDVES